MRYFWHAIIAIVFVAAIIFIFFIFSLKGGNHVTFTDSTTPITEPTVTIADPSVGDADAPVTIVSFGDYSCDTCADVENTLIDVIAKFPNQIRLVWKDMPNTSAHPEALNAAIAARCAGKQAAFFPYHSYLFANHTSLGSELYTSIAQSLKLNERTFSRCVEKQETLPLVEKSYDEGIALKITATPTIFINNERFTGAVSASEIEGAIRSALANTP